MYAWTWFKKYAKLFFGISIFSHAGYPSRYRYNYINMKIKQFIKSVISDVLCSKGTSKWSVNEQRVNPAPQRRAMTP